MLKNAPEIFTLRFVTMMFVVTALVLGGTTPGFAKGAVGGAKTTDTSVKPRGTDVFTVKFEGNAYSRVTVSGDGDTDLDLYVFDANNNLVGKDDDNSDDCIVEWTPKWTGLFTIKVVNRGNVENVYHLETN
ncbi:MAG: pre-peptidase C-terminal domain-containing protein [Pyrinomonadaceae bacterium]|nr:pre-peptidase C-terminal domain-containing protein [Pyrinomonadaceae bacterium]